ncbi:GNAT family N-acetyltransferase [Paenibacillus sp. JX-17]|uniref:GNAT family N-acetyltransferase n=1 Tax=Paenibacillus lacisoli TaxID=3064525 RepID=A0ABT9CGI4_9BACL|nr:GNAT family N-acetyltransferase [Paenibacillus sp. JX-17]MDO7908005.1 GNAT family N-acetyltransferase [Paenibacillus sp. JX-17]
MNHTIIIKEYDSSDQDEVLDLILDIQQKEYQISITQEDQPDLMKIESFYRTGSGNFWVALYDDQVIGTVGLLDIQEQQAALRKMFVSKAYRGGSWGASTQLLNQAILWAREHDLSAILLGTTPQFTAAHRFYEKNHFVEITKEQLPVHFPVMEVDKKFYRLSLK